MAREFRTTTLTVREYQCAILVGHGLTAKEIGARLGISDETVKRFLYDARFRTRTKNSAHLAVLVALADRKKREAESGNGN